MSGSGCLGLRTICAAWSAVLSSDLLYGQIGQAKAMRRGYAELSVEGVTMNKDLIKEDIDRFRIRIAEARQKLSELPVGLLRYPEHRRRELKRAVYQGEIEHVQRLIQYAMEGLHDQGFDTCEGKTGWARAGNQGATAASAGKRGLWVDPGA